MRRRLIIFLLVLLPFQFAWTAAAAYCSHEANPSAKHFGHHVHVHKAMSSSVDAGKHGTATAAPDADCPVCNLSAPPLPTELAVVEVAHPHHTLAPPDVPPPPSAIADTPERPNWSLAA